MWKTHALADCAGAGIEPTRYSVLVAMSEKQTQTAGGILLAPETLEREEFGATYGRIIALAPLVFTYAKPEEWGSARKPQVGDVVLVGKFSGVKVKGADDRDYRLISDTDILAVTERDDEAGSVPYDCAHVLCAAGKTYSGKCERCGLGPCPFYGADIIKQPEAVTNG